MLTLALLVSLAQGLQPAQASSGLVAFTDLTQMDNVVLDRPDGWLLISAGGEYAAGTQQGVQVTDLQGKSVQALLPAQDIIDVEMAPDGRSAWAADVTAGALDRISLSDFGVRTFPLPNGETPVEVAPVSSRWIVYTFTHPDPAAGPPGDAGLGVLDTSTGLVWQRASFGPPELRLIPSTRRVLEVDRVRATVEDFATGRPVPVSSGALDVACTLADVAVSPDGSSFVPACTDGTLVTEYRTADISVRARYHLPPGQDWVPYVDSVAYSGDGSMLAVGQFGVYASNITVLKRNSAGGWQGYYAKHLEWESVTNPRGVVFSPDSTTLYVLGHYVGGKADGPVTIETLPGTAAPVPPPTAMLTVASPATSFVGDPVTVTGSLHFSDTTDADAGADRAFTITRTLNGSTATVSETTDVHGGFSFPNSPTAAGTAVYTVRYDGDLLHAGTSASTSTSVVRHASQLTLAVDTTLTDAGYVLTGTAHLGPTYTNRTVTMLFNGTVIAAHPVDAEGNLTMSTPPVQCDFFGPCQLALKAVFAGDARYLPAEADSS